ncbi:hypothetical protein [Pannonibacter sp. SL95]|uniref:hypothetical protein n=1 Tax=Pannonibacter sp. SL95 TaxID=2995153 RepID=UPI0022737280|nr:hypothetical protein [Pannonibacter sp. SL95]MCY1705474.1 hypothetical protein [Pannonibacter sp. SL95]
MRPTITLALAAVLVPTLSHAKDPAVEFARFWGAVLAIEDACEAYEVKTDAVMGNHLSARDYAYAETLVEKERLSAETLVATLGCDEAAKDVLRMTDRSFFEVWNKRK